MTDDYPLGADNDTDAMEAWVDDAADCAPLPRNYVAVKVNIGTGKDFPAIPAGIVAGSDRFGLPATPKPHH